MMGVENTMPELNPYARFLDHRPVQTILAATPILLAAFAEKLGTEKLVLPPAPGKWSAAEILCHLADCEIAFAFRLRQTLAEDSHVMQPFDQDKWAAPYSGFGPDKGAAEALAMFTTLRHWNLRLIDASLPQAADKQATHPERGTMTFLTIVETMAGHDLNHLTQFEKLVAP
jgi:hypothetical protein